MLPGIKQFDLSGRCALVTGGSKGLGEAMAAGLASAGAQVMVTSRHAEEVEATAARLSETYGRRVIAMQADAADMDDVSAMTDHAIAEFGKLDILVNNAGINIRGPIDELSYEEFRAVQRVNVDGMWMCCRAAVPHMKRAGYGKIVNLASTIGLVGVPNRTPYASSKGAVVQMTRALALELAPFNISVNAICPGPFLTPMNESIADTEDGKRFIVGATALGRWARMEEIQGAAIFLASQASSYMVGSMVVVDGGWTAQ